MILMDHRGVTMGLAARLASGGEGEIFEISSHAGKVAKVYFAPAPERREKLDAMIGSPPNDPTAAQSHVSICWPESLLFDQNRQVVGFVMPKLDSATSAPLSQLCHPGDRKKLAAEFHWGYLLRTAGNIASVIEAIHAYGYVVGDLNESNLYVSDRALVTLIDCDSIQVPKPGGGFFRCPVGKPEYTPPELQGQRFDTINRRPCHDNFSLGILIFQILMEGVHPYAGVWQGAGDSPDLPTRIRNGDCPYAGSRNVLPMPSAPPFTLLPTNLRGLFVRCFGAGHSRSEDRPSPREWREALALTEKTLLTCNTNLYHVYPNHVPDCPWCERSRQLRGIDPFASSTQQKSLPRVTFLTGTTSVRQAVRKLISKKAPVSQTALWIPGVLAAAIILFLGWAVVAKVLPWARGQLKERSITATLQNPRIVEPEVNPLDKLSYVWIPPGTFQMGCNDSDPECMPEEKPQAAATVGDGFWIGQTEVTQAAYSRVSGVNPSVFKGDARLPVENVSWSQASSYCSSIGGSLPSEVQWEYAASGGLAPETPARPLSDIAWFHDNSGGRTHPVGEKSPNAFGLYDMLGNVWEWVDDWYAVPHGAAGNKRFRTRRGGSWAQDSRYARPSVRIGDVPGHKTNFVGFRCAMAHAPHLGKNGEIVVPPPPQPPSGGQNPPAAQPSSGAPPAAPVQPGGSNATKSDVLEISPQRRAQVDQTSKAGFWRDPTTGLVWAATDNGAAREPGSTSDDLPWESAQSYCRNLMLGGHSGWRLPTISELGGLYDPATTDTYRVLYAPSPYHIKGGIRVSGASWSSIPYTDAFVWQFGFFADGGRRLAARTNSRVLRALCVYGPSEEADRLQSQLAHEQAQLKQIEDARRQENQQRRNQTETEGYWSDPATGIAWAATDNGANIKWPDAAQYCERLTLAGSSGWRLPTIEELEAIYVPNANVQGRWVWGGFKGGLRSNLSADDEGPSPWRGVAWSSTASGDNMWAFACNGQGCTKTTPALKWAMERALCVRSLTSPPKAANSPSASPIHVGALVQQAQLINAPKPVYPPLAKAARVQGTVKFQAKIAKDGSVHDLVVVSGPPLLVQAATQAVLQWRYTPTMLNGEPAEVLTTIDINFTLSQ